MAQRPGIMAGDNDIGHLQEGGKWDNNIEQLNGTIEWDINMGQQHGTTLVPISHQIELFI